MKLKAIGLLLVFGFATLMVGCSSGESKSGTPAAEGDYKQSPKRPGAG